MTGIKCVNVNWVSGRQVVEFGKLRKVIAWQGS